MADASKGISVGCVDTEVYLRVVGRGTFQNSQPLRRFAHEMMESGCHDFVLDLAQCQSMDSTFLGVLAGIGLELRQDEPTGKIHVVNAAPPNRDLLHGLGLDRLFNVENGDYFTPSHPRPPERELQRLPDTDVTSLGHPLDREATADLMLEAHSDLIRANASNAEKFSEVTRCLRDKIARRQAELKQ